jgi:hypothetical protein
MMPLNWLKSRVFGRDVVAFPDKPSWKDLE